MPRLGDRVQVRTALERGVEVLTHVGEPRDAAVLFGCVTDDQILRRFMSGPERVLHDQAAERARTELGAAEFDRAAAEGSVDAARRDRRLDTRRARSIARGTRDDLSVRDRIGPGSACATAVPSLFSALDMVAPKRLRRGLAPIR